MHNAGKGAWKTNTEIQIATTSKPNIITQNHTAYVNNTNNVSTHTIIQK